MAPVMLNRALLTGAFRLLRFACDAKKPGRSAAKLVQSRLLEARSQSENRAKHAVS
jgi:hypothetical protein